MNVSLEAETRCLCWPSTIIVTVTILVFLLAYTIIIVIVTIMLLVKGLCRSNIIIVIIMMVQEKRTFVELHKQNFTLIQESQISNSV